MLFDLNGQIYQLRLDLLEVNPRAESGAAVELENILRQKRTMIWGEGLVFLLFLALGMIQTRKSYKRENRVIHQQKNFLLSVTHELKSPVAAVKLYLQTLAKRDFEKKQQQELIGRAIQENERLDQLVENILLATRIDNHVFLIQPERINLSKQVRRFNIDSVGIANSPVPTLTVQPDIYVVADFQAIDSILKNLVENAVKYSPGSAQVALSLYKDDGSVILEVSDQGVGIPDEEKKRIFSKFYRSGNEETRRTKGTGLGLYIVDYLVRQHHGTIEISDNIPKGSTFTIRLKPAPDDE